MHRNRFKKVCGSGMALGIGRSTLPNAGPFATYGTQLSASQSNFTINTAYPHAAGTIGIPWKYNHILINSLKGIPCPEFGIFLWANTIQFNANAYITANGAEGADGSDDGQGGNGGSGGGGGTSPADTSDGGEGGTEGGDGKGNYPGLGYGSGSVVAPWWFADTTYDVGKGGAGGEGGATGTYNGGPGGAGGNAVGGGGGGGAGEYAFSGAGGGGSGGCILIGANEIVSYNGFVTADGGGGYAPSPFEGGGGGGGGGVIYIFTRRMVGRFIAAHCSGGKAYSGSGVQGSDGQVGTCRIFAILPDNSLVEKTFTDQWDYL